MDNRDYLICLYDFYGDLFTEKQCCYFESYYFQNLSLSEISDNLKVSRNAIHKSLQRMEEKLLFYEEKLKLFHKNQLLCDIIKRESDKNIKRELEELIQGDEICE